MALRCCKCGQQSSSSSSRSASSGSGSGGSGSVSASSASASASSGSDDGGTIPCSSCNNEIAPAIFKMEWNLQNNCPNTIGSGTVDCYEQNIGPHRNISSTGFQSTNSFRCIHGLSEQTCYWKNNSTGEVEIDIPGRGLCGHCENGPKIVIAVSRFNTEVEGVFDYEINCYVYYFFTCFFIDNPGPPEVGTTYLGYVYLHYQKIFHGLPPNCLGSNELDLVCYDGFDEYTDPEGTVDWWGVGPGCNLSASVAMTFPTTVTVAPDDGGGTFP